MNPESCGSASVCWNEPVTNPGDGLGILERNPVDLLLADIRMPGMDGFQLIDRGLSWQPDLAIVFMTGFGTIEIAVEALGKGTAGRENVGTSCAH